MGQLHQMYVITEAKKLGLFAKIMNRIFPFPDKKYEFNLTHVILFSLLIALLSMVHHPAQDTIEHDAEKDAKREKKREAERKEKEKELLEPEVEKETKNETKKDKKKDGEKKKSATKGKGH